MSGVENAERKLVFLSKFISPSNAEIDIHGICVADDNSVLVSDVNNKRLLRYNESGVFQNSCHFSMIPRDITVIPGKNQVAVTLQESRFSCKPGFIAILDSEQLNLISQNEIKCTPFGIDWYENLLAVGSWNTVQFYDLDFSFVRSIELPEDKIAVKFIKRGPDGTLFYSTSTANCISSDGINIFKFSVENGIPRGLCVDKDKMLYISCCSSTILGISDKGHLIGTLLKGDQGLGQLGSLCFNKDYTKLYVASDDGSSLSVFDFLKD